MTSGSILEKVLRQGVSTGTREKVRKVGNPETGLGWPRGEVKVDTEEPSCAAGTQRFCLARYSPPESILACNIFAPAHGVVVELLALAEVGLVLKDTGGAGLLGDPAASRLGGGFSFGNEESLCPWANLDAPDVRGRSKGADDEASGKARSTANHSDDRVSLNGEEGVIPHVRASDDESC